MSGAAPELLAALRDLIEAAESMQGTFGCIRGRTPEHDDLHTHDQWAEGFLAERLETAKAALAVAEQTIPVGEATSSDFGAFMDEVRK